jgi:hypothetical protein
MRTTVDLDEDVLQAVRVLARERGLTFGVVLSELARQALKPSTSFGTRNELPVFEVREDAVLFGPDEIASELDDDA